MNSSVNKQVITTGTANTQEQSGWTTYLEDFSLDQQQSLHDDQNDHHGSFCSPSLVSDAASHAAWKMISDKNQVTARSSLDPSEFPKRLNFKKPKGKAISYYDDDLEDTASSPVNSPKVSSVKQNDINLRRPDDHSFGDFLGKREGSNYHGNINYDGKNNDLTELRKRGLCLVPLSVLMNSYHH